MKDLGTELAACAFLLEGNPSQKAVASVCKRLWKLSAAYGGQSQPSPDAFALFDSMFNKKQPNDRTK
jgi:hypothetical protein